MSKRATRILREAEALRNRNAQMVREDWQAQEIGFLESQIKRLCEDLDTFTGDSVKPSAGCDYGVIEHAGMDFRVEYEYEPLIPGRLSGPPENCYPDEGGALTIGAVLINGEWVDPREVFTDSVVEKWEETLYERCVESESDDRDYWLEEQAQQRRDDKLTGDV